jgi:8-oxo-dGTP diphosphatase
LASSDPLHVVGAAILDGDRCLAARRGPRMSLPGMWEFPGGKVEPGERPERALAREIHEELKLEIEVGECLARSEIRNDGGTLVLDVYTARAAPGEPHLREHAEVRWIAADALHGVEWALADVPIVPSVAALLRPHPDSERCPAPFEIVSVDWGLGPAKRAAYVARLREGWSFARAEPPSGGWTLEALLALARRLSDESGRRVLLGIDAVLGVPALLARAAGASSFLELLVCLARSGGLERESGAATSWALEQPFFRIPAGRGALTCFVDAAGGRSATLRQIERRTGAKTVLALSGIPGSVGSGSRALWRELAPLLDAPVRDFRVWPFDGDLQGDSVSPVVVAEVYPRASYAIALAGACPTKPFPIAKTRKEPRAQALDALSKARWVAQHGVSLGDLSGARESEDDFDALLTATALVRHFVEQKSLSCWLIDPLAEGGILGTGLLELPGAAS